MNDKQMRPWVKWIPTRRTNLITLAMNIRNNRIKNANVVKVYFIDNASDRSSFTSQLDIWLPTVINYVLQVGLIHGSNTNTMFINNKRATSDRRVIYHSN